MASLNLNQGATGDRGYGSAAVQPLNPARLGAPVGSLDRDDGDVELRFRRFRLFPRSRILLRDGRPVEIGGRAFDLLHVLLRSRGTVVSKRDIMNWVWPTTMVEECNLRCQAVVLRNALGEDRDLIKTVPGRGYLFAADEEQEAAKPAALAGPAMRGEVLRLVETAPDAWNRAAASPIVILAGSSETHETLRGLLQSVLDELWQMTQQGEGLGHPGLSFPVAANTSAGGQP